MRHPTCTTKRPRAQARAGRLEFLRQMEEEEEERATAPPSSRDTYGIEARARGEWERSAAIREEFTSLEAYTAFRKAEARGLVRIISRKA